ncbi:hypothetical protein ABB37_08555 [Leptomonas pyrrhocoris]|uniref:Uncharacterized protein n=1 Tax=Leptomonas pyrrhocoris TaxID=157538 RepID=A0A0M9FSL6_LEPPY|nr:hypothetical protein ABB37_08555 [Leptomonas pyrrhocoris]XP_015653689.1 hypothetical protein ABB37_08555 [Leptomonas pyrrhocoris]KPA75249.1 hypothetical protein ABB37_08555 [Leptomonas pyrrhocoris]KPA75250.1 hypothetical protein ABB37_08555 [Leptomonas pyrrhocoris]|eukprot:XP_015653688.1 hypothetical protein ABB37_08555 [Leptomonas pyrrhocoris]
MGAGSSAAKDSTETLPPACPVFYNFSPSTQHIPTSTLPTRDARGHVRRPAGGCAARIIALRHLPVVTPDARKEAKEFLAHGGTMKKAARGDEAALAKIKEMEEQARSVLRDPCLPPAVSSCFLINIAVDEQGRLAPLSTDGAAGLTDTMNMIDNCDSDNASECASTAVASQVHPVGRKGFNFDTANSGSNAQKPGMMGAGARRTSPPSDTRAAQEAIGNSNKKNNMASLPSPKSHRASATPSYDVTAVQRLAPQGTASGATRPTPSPPSGDPNLLPSIFVPPLVSTSDLDADGDDAELTALMNSSVRSLLIKGSRFRKGDGGESTPTPVTASLGEAATARLRRQHSRIKLLQVPNRTRWFLFNDSRTHEAQVTVMLCYTKQKDAADLPGKGSRRESPASVAALSPRNDVPASPSASPPGELKLMCVPTPLSHTATDPKELKKQLASMSSSSRSFVEIEPLSFSAFFAALPAPSGSSQRELLSKFEANVPGMAAVAVFVVLAPGATVFLAEGEATGYFVDTHMVPFNRSTSMAVLGRLLTPDLVRLARQKSEALRKDCHHHKLIFLSKQADPAPAGGATGPGNSISSPSLLIAKPAPAAEGRVVVPLEQPNRNTHPDHHQNNARQDTGGDRQSTASTASTTNTTSTTSANPSHPSAHAPKPLSRLSADATEAINAAGETAVQQQRISARSPSIPPARATTTEVNGGVVVGGSESPQARRKRIGPMLRNPSLEAAAVQLDDDAKEQSFHRDLPAANSFAISF